MLKKYSHPEPNGLLPWHANGTLASDEQRAVEDWLTTHPAAQGRATAWQQIRSATIAQPSAKPSPAVWQQLLAQIHSTRQPRPIRPAWAIGTLAAALVLIVLWLAVQPGIQLRWWPSDDGASAYRIYRTLEGHHDVSLLSVLPARPDAAAYTFVDTSSLPGQTYTYLIEIVNPSGQPIFRQTITGRGDDVLPAQLAVLLTSILSGYAVMFMAYGRLNPIAPRRPLGA